MSKKCFVFDFDCTLTYTHLFYFIHDFDRYLKMYNIPSSLRKLSNKVRRHNNKLTSYEKLTIINIIMGGYERLDTIKAFLITLICNGYSLFIASRGYLTDILYLLELSGIDANIFNYINASFPAITRKDMFLHILYQHGYTKIRYIDDTDTEHKKFTMSKQNPILDYFYYGSNIGLQKESLGLTTKMIDMIKKIDFIRN